MGVGGRACWRCPDSLSLLHLVADEACEHARAADARADRFLGLAHHADDLRPNLGRVGAQRLEHARGDALALAHEAEQDVLGADVVVAELARFLQGEFEHALGARRERDLDRDKPRPAPDHFLHLDARVLEVDAHRFEHLGRDAGRLADEAEQDLLGAHEVVAQAAGL